jgi:hypothetical protein
MTDPELFKFDVRVRERMLKRGRITEADVSRHLASLADLDSVCETVEQPQPALFSGRDGASGPSRPSVAPPAPHADDDLEAS